MTEINMDELYARNPGTERMAPTQIGSPADAAASTAGSASSQAAHADSTGYDPMMSQVQREETAAGQLADITSQDSPLMQRARAEATEYAASRGLRNSSVAAGATQASMVDRALPVAQQDAATHSNRALANQETMNRAREFAAGAENVASLENARMDTDTAQRNAEIEAERQRLNAQLETAVSQGNAAAANEIRIRQAELDSRAAEVNALETNRMRETIITQNAEMNRQYLAGTQAMDLATIQGQYQQLISQNEVAGRFYDSYFNSISSIMANDQLPPDRVARYVESQQYMLEAGLRMMESLNGIDFETSTPSMTSVGGQIVNTPAGSTTSGANPGGSTPPSFQQWRAGTYRDPNTGQVVTGAAGDAYELMSRYMR